MFPSVILGTIGCRITTLHISWHLDGCFARSEGMKNGQRAICVGSFSGVQHNEAAEPSTAGSTIYSF